MGHNAQPVAVDMIEYSLESLTQNLMVHMRNEPTIFVYQHFIYRIDLPKRPSLLLEGLSALRATSWIYFAYNTNQPIDQCARRKTELFVVLIFVSCS